MTKAVWNGVVLAESNETEVVEGNHYFPPNALHHECFRAREHQTVCGWKGTASYYDVIAHDCVNEQAAWYYPAPKEAASNIKGEVAFWKGVQVTS